jgi:ADP-ribose diphosphatase
MPTHSKPTHSKPIISATKTIAKTRLFQVDQIELEFSNGQQRTYERLVAGSNGAVLIVALNQNNELILIREYSAGTNDYQLAFPKGLIETGEAVLAAANRELKEEVGFGAKDLTPLKSMSLAPGYLTHKMNIVFAQGLYPEKLEGDEPEPLEIVKWPFENIDLLLAQEDFTESRSIAALLLVIKHLEKL